MTPPLKGKNQKPQKYIPLNYTRFNKLRVTFENYPLKITHLKITLKDGGTFESVLHLQKRQEKQALL
jgi:hypothetical protein